MPTVFSPFAEENNQEQDGDDDDDDDECNRGACGGGKSAKSDEGAVLTSLVHTTLHGDCRPVLEYGIVSMYIYTICEVHLIMY